VVVDVDVDGVLGVCVGVLMEKIYYKDMYYYYIYIFLLA